MLSALPHHLPHIQTSLIECDHLELVERVEAVRAAVVCGDPKLAGGALERLRDFALTHFGLEECMMIASCYPQTREHIRMHQRLIGVLNRMLHRNRFANAVLSEETIAAIEELHRMHMRTDDAEFGHWLNARPA